MDNSKKTQRNILKSARRTFLRQGYGGARMQEIADDARVNKALLHYHFKNKEQLFREVLQSEAERVAGIFHILEDDSLPYPDKLRAFSEAMIRLSEKDPDCLPFLLQSARTYPEFLDPPLDARLNLAKFLSQVETGMSHGFIPGKDASALTLRLLALAMVFPLAGDLVQVLLGKEATDRHRNALSGEIQKLLGAGA